MSDDYDASVRVQWAIFSRTVVDLAPFLNEQGLHYVIIQLRPATVDEAGARGPWAHLLGEPLLDDYRQQLLYDFVELYEQKTGNRWPFLNDRRPEVPDDLSGLEDPPS